MSTNPIVRAFTEAMSDQTSNVAERMEALMLKITEWSEVIVGTITSVSSVVLINTENTSKIEAAVLNIGDELDHFHNETINKENSVAGRLDAIEETLIGLGRVIGDFRAEIYAQQTEGEEDEGTKQQH